MTAPLQFDDATPPRPTPPAPAPVPPAPRPGPTVPPADDARVQAALDHVKSMLVAGETLQTYAVQRRLFALTHRRILVAATSGRLIVICRRLLGGFLPIDTRWQDLQEISTRVGIFGADLIVSTFNHPDFASAESHRVTRLYAGLRKAEAAAVYRIAQGQEQAWREKRRGRELEETRARSGGIQLGSLGQGGAGAHAGLSAVERLANAKALLDQGLISDSEYENIKARIVGDM